MLAPSRAPATQEVPPRDGATPPTATRHHRFAPAWIDAGSLDIRGASRSRANARRSRCNARRQLDATPQLHPVKDWIRPARQLASSARSRGGRSSISSGHRTSPRASGADRRSSVRSSHRPGSARRSLASPSDVSTTRRDSPRVARTGAISTGMPLEARWGANGAHDQSRRASISRTTVYTPWPATPGDAGRERGRRSECGE